MNWTAEIHQHFRGYARFNFADIDLTSGRDVDEANVTRLARTFELQGCLHDNPLYAISVMVDREICAETSAGQVDPSSFIAPLMEFNPKIQAVCLHGKHRILAAQRVLHTSDQWWIVRVFDSGLSIAAREQLQYEDNVINDSKPADGEIFRRALDAELKGDQKIAAHWSAMLTERKRRNLRELKTIEGGRLLAALEPLLPLEALWADFQPGALNRVLPMRCREEICYYLKCIHQVWMGILGVEVPPERLDVHTVRLLYLRMPAHSKNDALYIERSMYASTTFPTAQSETVRNNLLSRILACEKVLTFKSFHADMILLEACYQPLRQLWPQETGSLRQICQSSFRRDDREFEGSYVEVWIYSIRNYFQLPEKRIVPLKRSRSERGPESLSYKEAAVADLELYAASLGFGPGTIDVSRTRSAQQESSDTKWVPALSGGSQEVHLQDRCGRPRKALFESCWRQMSLKSVFLNRSEHVTRHATPFAVARTFVRSLLEYEWSRSKLEVESTRHPEVPRSGPASTKHIVTPHLGATGLGSQFERYNADRSTLSVDEDFIISSTIPSGGTLHNSGGGSDVAAQIDTSKLTGDDKEQYHRRLAVKSTEGTKGVDSDGGYHGAIDLDLDKAWPDRTEETDVFSTVSGTSATRKQFREREGSTVNGRSVHGLQTLRLVEMCYPERLGDGSILPRQTGTL